MFLVIGSGLERKITISGVTEMKNLILLFPEEGSHRLRESTILLLVPHVLHRRQPPVPDAGGAGQPAQAKDVEGVSGKVLRRGALCSTRFVVVISRRNTSHKISIRTPSYDIQTWLTLLLFF